MNDKCKYCSYNMLGSCILDLEQNNECEYFAFNGTIDDIIKLGGGKEEIAIYNKETNKIILDNVLSFQKLINHCLTTHNISGREIQNNYVLMNLKNISNAIDIAVRNIKDTI